MRKYIRYISCYLLFMLLCFIEPIAQETVNKQANASLITKDQANLVSFLSAIAERYDCYFTIESGWQETEAENIIESSVIDVRLSQVNGSSYTLKQVLALMPNVTYKANSSNPKILHVIDNRLQNQEKYALEQVLTYIEFSGYLASLPSVIKQHSVNISGPKMFSFSDMRSLDFKTKTSVKAQNVTVRELLSTATNKGRNKRILWVSRTKIGNDETSHIYFDKK